MLLDGEWQTSSVLFNRAYIAKYWSLVRRRWQTMHSWGSRTRPPWTAARPRPASRSGSRGASAVWANTTGSIGCLQSSFVQLILDSIESKLLLNKINNLQSFFSSFSQKMLAALSSPVQQVQDKGPKSKFDWWLFPFYLSMETLEYILLRYFHNFLMIPYLSLFRYSLPFNSFFLWPSTFQDSEKSLDFIIFVMGVFVKNFD